MWRLIQSLLYGLALNKGEDTGADGRAALAEGAAICVSCGAVARQKCIFARHILLGQIPTCADLEAEIRGKNLPCFLMNCMQVALHALQEPRSTSVILGYSFWKDTESAGRKGLAYFRKSAGATSISSMAAVPQRCCTRCRYLATSGSKPIRVMAVSRLSGTLRKRAANFAQEIALEHFLPADIAGIRASTQHAKWNGGQNANIQIA